MHGFTSIPFKTKTDSGFSNVNGVAKFSAAGIVLEFESKLLGLVSTGIKEARLAIDQIRDVKFRKGVFKRGAKVEIRSHSLMALTGIPHKDGKVVLEIAAADFEAAREAADRLEHDISDYAANLPPPHPPVASLFGEGEAETKELP